MDSSSCLAAWWLGSISRARSNCFWPGCHSFLLVKDAEADDAFRIPRLELDRPEEVFFRFLAVTRGPWTGPRPEAGNNPPCCRSSGRLLPGTGSLLHTGPGCTAFCPGGTACPRFYRDPCRPRRHRRRGFGRSGRGPGGHQGFIGFRDAVEQLVDLRFQLRVEIPAEPVGMKFPGEFEVGLLDLRFVGLLAEFRRADSDRGFPIRFRSSTASSRLSSISRAVSSTAGGAAGAGRGCSGVRGMGGCGRSDRLGRGLGACHEHRRTPARGRRLGGSGIVDGRGRVFEIRQARGDTGGTWTSRTSWDRRRPRS